MTLTTVSTTVLYCDVSDMSAMMRLPWQRPLPSNGALNIQQLWASGGRMHEPILIKFGTQLQITTSMIVTWSNNKIFKIQNGERPPCWKCYYSPTNVPICTKLGWSHPIMSPTCPLWCGCHGNCRCLAMAHWTFSSYGRLEAERVNQFW